MSVGSQPEVPFTAQLWDRWIPQVGAALFASATFLQLVSSKFTASNNALVQFCHQIQVFLPLRCKDLKCKAQIAAELKFYSSQSLFLHLQQQPDLYTSLFHIPSTLSPCAYP